MRLTIETPDGPYRLDTDWLIAADGARSTARSLLGLDFAGVTFEDKFLIADVHMAAEFPTERRFWFAPTFHSGQSALMHRQPDDIWRIDLQLGPDADAVAEQEPARVRARLDKVLKAARLRARMGFGLHVQLPPPRSLRARPGDLYRRRRASGFAVRRPRRQFRHPGCGKPGVEARRFAQGGAGSALIESYDRERIQAADENIGNSTRSTDFMSPHSSAERRLRDAVLALAPKAEFARRMINSGRLSVPAVYDLPLSTPDATPFAGTAKLGAPLPDAPLRRADGAATHLVENLRGDFGLIHVRNGAAANGQRPRAFGGIALTVVGEDVFDDEGKFTQRFDATPGATYLVRPDQHLCARWRSFDAAAVTRAQQRALQR